MERAVKNKADIHTKEEEDFHPKILDIHPPTKLSECMRDNESKKRVRKRRVFFMRRASRFRCVFL